MNGRPTLVLALSIAGVLAWRAAPSPGEEAYVPFRNEVPISVGSPLPPEFWKLGATADEALARKAFEYYYGKDVQGWPKFIRENVMKQIAENKAKIESAKKSGKYDPARYGSEEALIQDPFLGTRLDGWGSPVAFLDYFMVNLLDLSYSGRGWSRLPRLQDTDRKMDALLAGRRLSLLDWASRWVWGRYPEEVLGSRSPADSSLRKTLGLPGLIEEEVKHRSRTFEWSYPPNLPEDKRRKFRIALADSVKWEGHWAQVETKDVSGLPSPQDSRSVCVFVWHESSLHFVEARTDPETDPHSREWNRFAEFNRGAPVVAFGDQHVVTARNVEKPIDVFEDWGLNRYQWPTDACALCVFPERLPLDPVRVCLFCPDSRMPPELWREMRDLLRDAVVAAVARGFEGAGRGGASARPGVPDIKASCDPLEVKADGASRVKVKVRLFERVRGTATRGLAGKKVAFSIVRQYDVEPGTLAAAEATTNGEGWAEVELIAPGADRLLEGRIVSGAVLARCPELGLEDTAYCSFLTDRGEVSVEPHWDGIGSNRGLMPPDPRFPVRISARLQDANGKPLAKAKVTFASPGHDGCRGKFHEKPGGPPLDRFTTATDEQGQVKALFAYASGDPAPGTVLPVEISARGLSRPLKAYVELGLDLFVENVRNGLEGKQVVNAGDDVALRVSVGNRSRPGGGDLSAAFCYWGLGGDSGDTRLELHLDVEPTGHLPQYLLDRLAIRSHPNPPLRTSLSLQFVKTKETRENLLWVREGSALGYQGLPRVRPMHPGETRYRARVSLVDSKGAELPDPTPDDNVAYFSVPVGVPADALSIFFLENPFGANTPQSALFREVLDFAGLGMLIEMADLAAMVNAGDYEGLAAYIVGKVKDWLNGQLEERPGLPSHVAATMSWAAFTEQVVTLAEDKPGPLAELEHSLVKGLAALLAPVDMKKIILVGDGSQCLVRKDTGEVVPCPEGALPDPGEGGGVCFRRGKVSVYCVPAKHEYEPRNARKVRIY